jgi:hypothetical protein
MREKRSRPIKAAPRHAGSPAVIELRPGNQPSRSAPPLLAAAPPTVARAGLCETDAEQRPYAASMGIYVFKKQVGPWGQRGTEGAGGRGWMRFDW